MRKIEKIYREYYDTVFKYLFCLTHDKEISEDLVQETFIRMIKNIDKFEGKSKLSSWLCEIAKKLWIDYLRKNKRKVELNENEELNIQSEQNIENEYKEREDENKVFEKIKALDEISQKVMYLRIKGEMSFKEIGVVLGKSENWARVTFYRAKQKVKEEM